MKLGYTVLSGLVAWWIADQLAATDADVDEGVAAYQSGDFETAKASFESVIERREQRPELVFDLGLAQLALQEGDAAQALFERATESEYLDVRAGAHYELGNLAFDREEWQLAIEHYIDALKAQPEHADAKWNLELALERQRQAEEDQEDQDQQDDQDSSDDSEENQDEEAGESGDDQDEEAGESGDDQDEEAGESGDDQDEEAGGESGGEQNEEAGESGDDQDDDAGGESGGEQDEEAGESGGEQDEDAEGESGGEQDEGAGEQQTPGEDSPPSNEGSEDEASSDRTQLQQIDLERALEQLDEQDGFTVDRPIGGAYVPPEKDW